MFLSQAHSYGRTSSTMSDSSVSDIHSGGTARTVSQQTSPSHGTHFSSQSRQENSTTLFTAQFDYIAQGEDELSLQRGETVEVNIISSYLTVGNLTLRRFEEENIFQIYSEAI